MSHQYSKQILLGIFIALFLVTMPTYAVKTFKVSENGSGHQIWFEVEDYDERNPDTDEHYPVVDKDDAFGKAINRTGVADGGETWSIEDGYENGIQGASGNHTPAPGASFKPVTACPGNIDFAHPDFAMTLRRLNNNIGPSHFYYSYNRGRAWEGPFELPNSGTPGIAARTDYIVNGKHDCMIFLTAAKSNGREGRPLCMRTEDGGKTWKMVSWIGPEPERYAIMPASVRLSESDILVIIRMREDRPEGARGWLASYLSKDNGLTWHQLADPVSMLGGGSNPPALIQLKDGRLCLTYGVRAEPFRICAKLSSDQGRTWSEEIVLRDDGANGDIGYPRNVERPDGKVVTVYYFNDSQTGPERYIGATIWSPIS